MSKDFHRIEKGVSIVVGKPLTWLCFLTWILCCWCYALTCRFGMWLRQRFAKHKGPSKVASRAKASISP